MYTVYTKQIGVGKLLFQNPQQNYNSNVFSNKYA